MAGIVHNSAQGIVGLDMRRLIREAESLRKLKTLREYVDQKLNMARMVGWPTLAESFERDLQAIEQAMREMEAA